MLNLNIYKVTARQPLNYTDKQGIPVPVFSDVDVLAENEADALTDAKALLHWNEKTDFLVARVSP